MPTPRGAQNEMDWAIDDRRSTWRHRSGRVNDHGDSCRMWFTENDKRSRPPKNIRRDTTAMNANRTNERFPMNRQNASTATNTVRVTHDVWASPYSFVLNALLTARTRPQSFGGQRSIVVRKISRLHHEFVRVV